MIIFESWTPRWRPQHDLEDTGEVDKPEIGLLPVRGYRGGPQWNQCSQSYVLPPIDKS